MWLLLLLVGLASGQDAEFSETKKEIKKVEKPVATLQAEAGGAFTTGNTEFLTVTGSITAGYKWDRNRVSVLGGGVFGSGLVDADGSGSLSDAERFAGRVTTAKRLSVDGRYDRFFKGKNSLYVLAGVFTDPFSGYKLRAHEQVGYSRTLYKTEETTLVGELGVDYAQEVFVEGVNPERASVLAARAMFGITHKLNEGVSFSNQLEVYENVIRPIDLRILNNASLTAKLSQVLGLKLSHTLIFDNEPVTGFRPADQTTMVTVVATLL